MKPKEYIQRSLRFWTIGLTVALILLGQFPTVDAQTSKPKIITTGADDTFEQALSQPAQLLRSIGITPEEIQKQLEPRPHIFVAGAGFVRNVGLASFVNTPDTQSTQSSIHVEGAGAARIVGLAVFTETPNLQPPKSTIHVAGAGSVRNVGLVAPLVQ